MIEKNNKTVGDRIRQLREDVKMTQQEFADELAIVRKTLIRYESDEYPPTADFLIRLNMLCGAQPLWVLTGRGPSVDGGLSPRETRLLSLYRGMNEQSKLAAEQMFVVLTAQTELRMVAEPKTKYEGSQQTFKSKVDQVAGRDIVNTDKGKK